MPLCFCRRDRKGVDLDGRRGGENLREENINRIHCMQKNSFRQKKKKKSPSGWQQPSEEQ